MPNIPTKVQEEGSLWILKNVLKNNVSYDSSDDIKKEDKGYNDLKKIFKGNLDETGNVPESWITSFYKQQEAMLKKFSNPQFTEFRYSGTKDSFHDFIKDIYKQYGKGKYENWNAADIWIVKNQKEVEKEIKNSISGSIVTQDVNRLNAILRKLFKQHRVIGISLKKVSGGSAKFEEVNIDSKHFFEKGKQTEKLSYKQKPKLDLSIDIEGSLQYNTQDLVIILHGKKEVKFQIKGNQTSRYSNLKYEASLPGSGGRSGKAEIDKVSKLIKLYTGKQFHNNHNDHPKTYREFIKLSNQKKYLKLYNEIKKHVETNIEDAEFLSNFKFGFRHNPVIANIKLLLMEFMSFIIQIPNNKLEDFWIDMVWLSEKKGRGFGPHGKLY